MATVQNREVQCPIQKPEDYEAGINSMAYCSGGSGTDIFKRLNAMLENTLDMTNINGEQNKAALPQMPLATGPHSQQGMNHGNSYHDNYTNSAPSGNYQGFQLFYTDTAQQQQQQQQQQQHHQQQQSQYKQDSQYPSIHCKPDQGGWQTAASEPQLPGRQRIDSSYQHLFKQLDSSSSSCSTPMKGHETPQKRAIRGTEKMTLGPQSPGYSSGDNSSHEIFPIQDSTLSPIEQILYSGLMSSSANQSRSPPPYESDTSGFSSEGSEAALVDMMAALKVGQRQQSSASDVARQLYTTQQQQQQQQQHQSQQQQQQLQQQLQQQQQNQLMQYTNRGIQGQQIASNNGNPFAMTTTDQTIHSFNARAAQQAAQQQVMRPFGLPIANLDLYAIDRAARLHRSAAGNAMHEASCTWSGKIPPKNYKNATTFSCKVFLGGVPWDITEAGLQASFNKFGTFKIEWPGRDGYVYLLFETEKAVKALLQECTHDYSNGEYYFNISSRRMRSKEVQVIPWMLTDSNFVRQPSQRLDANKTVFVGALHGMISAETLAMIINDLFANVVYAGIDSDKHKYPIGSGRVTFSSRRSYMKAVTAAFVEIKTPKFTKKIQIDPYLEDSLCSQCGFLPGPYFCRDLQCFKYYCRTCWYCKHEPDAMRNHKPLSRNTKAMVNLGLM